MEGRFKTSKGFRLSKFKLKIFNYLSFSFSPIDFEVAILYGKKKLNKAGGYKQCQVVEKELKFQKALKKTAIDLVINAGKSISKLSKELGLNYKTVARWLRKHKPENNLIEKDPVKEEIK